MVCWNCIDLTGNVPFRRDLTEESGSEWPVRTKRDFWEDPCAGWLAAEIPPCQQFLRNKCITDRCSSHLGKFLDDHRSIACCNNALGAEIPGKEYKKLIPADIPS